MICFLFILTVARLNINNYNDLKVHCRKQLSLLNNEELADSISKKYLKIKIIKLDYNFDN